MKVDTPSNNSWIHEILRSVVFFGGRRVRELLLSCLSDSGQIMAAIPRQRYCETRKGKRVRIWRKAQTHLVEKIGKIGVKFVIGVKILPISGRKNTNSFFGSVSGLKTERQKERERISENTTDVKKIAREDSSAAQQNFFFDERDKTGKGQRLKSGW